MDLRVEGASLGLCTTAVNTGKHIFFLKTLGKKARYLRWTEFLFMFLNAFSTFTFKRHERLGFPANQRLLRLIQPPEQRASFFERVEETLLQPQRSGNRFLLKTSKTNKQKNGRYLIQIDLWKPAPKKSVFLAFRLTSTSMSWKNGVFFFFQ